MLKKCIENAINLCIRPSKGLFQNCTRVFAPFAKCSHSIVFLRVSLTRASCAAECTSACGKELPSSGAISQKPKALVLWQALCPAARWEPLIETKLGLLKNWWRNTSGVQVVTSIWDGLYWPPVRALILALKPPLKIARQCGEVRKILNRVLERF